MILLPMVNSILVSYFVSYPCIVPLVSYPMLRARSVQWCCAGDASADPCARGRRALRVPRAPGGVVACGRRVNASSIVRKSKSTMVTLD